jgi:Asp-tRNA(Asn)/Glu-tRNA(Gln) amidotransferase A subunit family amidase
MLDKDSTVHSVIVTLAIAGVPTRANEPKFTFALGSSIPGRSFQFVAQNRRSRDFPFLDNLLPKRFVMVPAVSDRLEYLAAYRLLGLFRKKELSPVDVLRAQIARIESCGDRINAFTHRHFDEALKAAKESEARYQRGGARPLEGITVAVKDEYDKKGWTVTSGSVLFKDRVSKETHPVVDKLLAAGAILHGQTTAPELFLVAVTWSDLWGVTRNPWNPDCTPGGSSGGSGAALAAGMATLAIGSDMGGSIRIPCALNGLYGSKPAYGRIASPDPSAFVPHASPGPLAREARDQILLQNVMTGPAPGCPAVLQPRLELPLVAAPTKQFRVAVSIDQGWATIDPEVRANTWAAVKCLEDYGVGVDEIKLPLETGDAQMRAAIEKGLFSTAIGADLVDLKSKAGQMTTYGRHFVRLACEMGPTDARDAAAEALRLYKIIDGCVFQNGYDALITPTVASSRIAADYDPTVDEPVINGKRVDPYAGWILTSVFSLLNWMPVISVPTGLSSNNVPTGMQIACRPYEDGTAAALALCYAEAAAPMQFDRVLF